MTSDRPLLLLHTALAHGRSVGYVSVSAGACLCPALSLHGDAEVGNEGPKTDQAVVESSDKLDGDAPRASKFGMLIVLSGFLFDDMISHGRAAYACQMFVVYAKDVKQ